MHVTRLKYGMCTAHPKPEHFVTNQAHMHHWPLETCAPSTACDHHICTRSSRTNGLIECDSMLAPTQMDSLPFPSERSTPPPRFASRVLRPPSRAIWRSPALSFIHLDLVHFYHPSFIVCPQDALAPARQPRAHVHATRGTHLPLSPQHPQRRAPAALHAESAPPHFPQPPRSSG